MPPRHFFIFFSLMPTTIAFADFRRPAPPCCCFISLIYATPVIYALFDCRRRAPLTLSLIYDATFCFAYAAAAISSAAAMMLLSICYVIAARHTP